ncbi:MAG: signal peptidase I [Turicibacter sp.]|nr:signal peptidase I [Turicibacter sp.]
MTYEKFEHKAIMTLLDRNEADLEKLMGQFSDAEVLQREETPAGFSVDFEIPEQLSIGPMTKTITGVRVTENKTGVLALELVIANGLIKQLVGRYIADVTYAELVTKFNELTFSYAEKPERVLAPPIVAMSEQPIVIKENVVRDEPSAPFFKRPDRAPTPFKRPASELAAAKPKEIAEKGLEKWKVFLLAGVNAIFYFFFAFFLVMILLLNAQNTIGEPNFILGFSAIRVASPSMQETIPEDSLVVLRRVNPNRLAVDHIVTYIQEDGLLITHRIDSVSTDADGDHIGFSLRGDEGDDVNDQIVPSEDIVGRVVFSNRTMGRFSLLFEQHFLLTSMVITSLIIVAYLWKRIAIKQLMVTPTTKEVG